MKQQKSAPAGTEAQQNETLPQCYTLRPRVNPCGLRCLRIRHQHLQEGIYDNWDERP